MDRLVNNSINKAKEEAREVQIEEIIKAASKKNIIMILL